MAVGITMIAASGVVDEAGFSSLLGHFSFLFHFETWFGGDTPRVLYEFENKDVTGKGICRSMKTQDRP
jgi:hypothetical protein